MPHFKLHSDYQPAGDQPQAIKQLVAGVRQHNFRNQTLLGVTGSGKTFTMAHMIAQCQKPALIIAPNKTLAAQLYAEFKAFFPENSVEYFVSYYDYYQPEAYVARSDTYIEKSSSINEQIDRLRHGATRALLEQDDVIIVASVSCLYGLGSVEAYQEMVFTIELNQEYVIKELAKTLSSLQYARNDIDFRRGNFRVRGDIIDIFPSHYEDRAWRLEFFGEELEQITEFDPLTGETHKTLEQVKIFPNSHHVTPGRTISQAIKLIQADLKIRLKELQDCGDLVAAQRLEQRTQFDVEMLEATGMCSGIENYSRYLSGRKEGEAPPTLFEYFPKDSLLFVDESHVALPQIRGMYRGDYARKHTLSEHGFRLPSCKDNRPLKFEEWDSLRPQTIFVSATPSDYENEVSQQTVEQVIRPTGLLDPVCIVKPIRDQVDDVIHEAKNCVAVNERVIINTLTKKMAEDLTEYLFEEGLKVRYIHADVDTVERVEILRDLRLGVFDILVGINLLREGIDVPECSLVAILDADKEGYLRSKTALIQIIGRAARNSKGRAILYADKITDSLQYALEETERRRVKQMQHNAKHGITPQTVIRSVEEGLKSKGIAEDEDGNDNQDDGKTIDELRKQMLTAAENLEFEEATRLRDKIIRLEKDAVGVN